MVEGHAVYSSGMFRNLFGSDRHKTEYEPERSPFVEVSVEEHEPCISVSRTPLRLPDTEIDLAEWVASKGVLLGPLSILNWYNPYAYTIELTATRGSESYPWDISVLLPPRVDPSQPVPRPWIPRISETVYGRGAQFHGPCLLTDVRDCVRGSDGDTLYVPWTTDEGAEAAFSYYLTRFLSEADAHSPVIDRHIARVDRAVVTKHVYARLPTTRQFRVVARVFNPGTAESPVFSGATVTLGVYKPKEPIASVYDRTRDAYGHGLTLS